MIQGEEASQKRKKYTQIQGFVYIHQKYKKQKIELPTLWIDSNDIETVKEFSYFWAMNPVELNELLYAMDRNKRNQFYELVRRCAKTCSSLQHNLYNIFLNQILEQNETLFFQMEEEGERDLAKGIWNYREKKKRTWLGQTIPNFIKPQTSLYDKSKTVMRSIGKSLYNFFSFDKKGKELCSKQSEGLIQEDYYIEKSE